MRVASLQRVSDCTTQVNDVLSHLLCGTAECRPGHPLLTSELLSEPDQRQIGQIDYEPKWKIVIGSTDP